MGQPNLLMIRSDEIGLSSTPSLQLWELDAGASLAVFPRGSVGTIRQLSKAGTNPQILLRSLTLNSIRKLRASLTLEGGSVRVVIGVYRIKIGGSPRRCPYFPPYRNYWLIQEK
jgi:hypothetical protein